MAQFQKQSVSIVSLSGPKHQSYLCAIAMSLAANTSQP
jgi:hypothetical protein